MALNDSQYYQLNMCTAFVLVSLSLKLKQSEKGFLATLFTIKYLFYLTLRAGKWFQNMCLKVSLRRYCAKYAEHFDEWSVIPQTLVDSFPKK